MPGMHPLQDEHLWAMIDGAIIGALGGVINSIRNKTMREWGQTVATILTAGFTGMLAQLVAGWWGTDVRLQFAISGIAGYGGGILLDDIVKRVRGVISSAASVVDGLDKLQKGLAASAKATEQKEHKVHTERKEHKEHKEHHVHKVAKRPKKTE